MTSPNSTPPRPQREPRQKISREEVISMAISMIDEGGLEAMSMRKLAERLGVYPASVYWHAGTKAQLLAIVCQAALSDVEVPEYDGAHWREWIVDVGRSIRSSFGAHPNLVVYFTGQIQVSTPSLLLTERMLTVLEDAGFSGDQLVQAYNTTMSSIFGWLNGEFATAPRDAHEGWEEYFRDQLKATAAEDLPTIHRNLAQLENRAFMVRWDSGRVRPMTESFEFMLATVVSGLEVMAARATSGAAAAE